MIEYGKLRPALENLLVEAGLDREDAVARAERVISEIYFDHFKARVTSGNVFDQIFTPRVKK
jgi:hypothetical protein